MYKGQNNTNNTEIDIFDYIEDYDIYNSEYILLLDKNENYEIKQSNKYRHRLDLLNKEFYSNEIQGILGINNRIFNEQELELNKELKVFSQLEINTIQSNLLS